MCEPMTMMLMSTGASVLGGIQQAGAQRQAGENQRQAAEFNAAQIEQAAGVERDNAAAEAMRIRRAARGQAGAARAALGAMNVDLSGDTSKDIQNEIDRGGELDAFMAILSGERRAQSARTQAGQLRREGQAAQDAANARARSTVLGSALNAADGWSRWRAAGARPRQAPAPVTDLSIYDTE